MSALFFIISAVVVGLDQLTKWLFYGKSFSLIGEFLWVESSFNTGAAFSMLSGAQWLFIILTLVAGIAIIYLVLDKKIGLTKLTKVALCMILGGAIGNLIDRLWLGGVRDFIYFKSINFAIFNIADSFITIGAIILAISIFINAIKSFKGKNDGISK